MEVKEAIERLEGSEEFKKWRKGNNEDYISYAFCQIDGAKKTDWQIGYYNDREDKITGFIAGAEIKALQTEEVFKKPDTKVKMLDLSMAELTFFDAMRRAEEFKKENYPGEDSNKAIVILQNIENTDVWNITLITLGFKALNIRMNAKTGDIMEHNIISIFEFKKKDDAQTPN